MKTLTVVDTFGFFFRAYYALPSLSSKSGFPTGLLTGFINFIHKFINEHSADYIIFAIDSEKKSFREELYPKYKANRKKAPEDLILQLKVAIPWIEKMGFATIGVERFEADDVIASIAKLAKREKLNVKIISNDKDLYQLIDNKTILIYDWVKKSLIDEQKCLEKFGVKPKNFVDFQALVGDSSDNIPGVKGIGVKKASKLINEYQTLEEIYKNIENIPTERTKKLLLEGKEEAFLSRELVKLRDNLFAKLDFEKFKLKNENYLVNLKDEFEKYQMKQALNWANSQNRVKIDFRSTLLNKREELFKVISNIPDGAVVVFDTETDLLDTKRANLVGFSFAFEENQAYYVPVGHNYLGVEEQISLEDAKKAIKKIMKFKIVGQNLKFDLSLIYNLFGISRVTPEADTMIMGWLIDSDSKFNLEFMAKKYLGYEMISYSDLVKKGQNFSSVNIQNALHYSSEDAVVTLKLYHKLKNRLEKMEKVERVAEELEFPFINVLISMERYGIKVDIDFLKELEKDLSIKLSGLTKDIESLTETKFNINSTKQLGEVLFNKLRLKGSRRTKTGYSTNEKILRKIEDSHPVIKKILNYREIKKLLSTYIKPLIKLSESDKNHRIYTTFLQTGTATGRLSSKEPNLQNIPVRTSIGRKIREAFISENGYKLLSIDYSQIELRLLAHFSQDETLIKAFKNEEDIHLATSIKLFGEERAKIKRNFAKTINFGILYGMGARKLSNELNIPISEAREIIISYFNTFPTIKSYIAKIQNSVRRDGFIETILGRRRYFYFDYEKSYSEKRKDEIVRESVNTLFQGSVADLIKVAMLRIDEVIEREKLNSRMLLQIHDELIFEVKDSSANEIGEKFKTIMENIYPLKNVDLKCSLKIADNWGMLK